MEAGCVKGMDQERERERDEGEAREENCHLWKEIVGRSCSFHGYYTQYTDEVGL